MTKRSRHFFQSYPTVKSFTTSFYRPTRAARKIDTAAALTRRQAEPPASLFVPKKAERRQNIKAAVRTCKFRRSKRCPLCASKTDRSARPGYVGFASESRHWLSQPQCCLAVDFMSTRPNRGRPESCSGSRHRTRSADRPGSRRSPPPSPMTAEHPRRPQRTAALQATPRAAG